MHEELRHALAVVIPPNGFSKEVVDINYDELLSSLILLVFGDWEGVSDDDLVDDVAVVHLLETVTTKEAMGCKAVDLSSSATFDNSLRSCNPGR